MSSASLPNGFESFSVVAPANDRPGVIERLARELRGLRPLTRAVGRGLRVAHPSATDESGDSWCRPCMTALAEELEMRAPELVSLDSVGLTSFDGAAALRLRPCLDELSAGDGAPLAAPREVAERIEPDAWLNRSAARADDGALLPVYTAGDPACPPVLVVGPCGMPVELLARWVGALAREHYVITCETRGLFDLEGFSEQRTDTKTQAADVACVLAHVGVPEAHVMGLCGGAVLALVAAIEQPALVQSLSLWHGDFAGCAASKRTSHQDDVAAVMAMAGSSRAQATSLHKVFSRPSVLSSLREDLAHQLLVPYATPELLFRYGRLNGDIMTTDLAALAPRVRVPAFVVTSDDDVTAHPDGSRYIASLLKVPLHVEPHGDHLSLFDAPPALVRLAGRVIAGDLGSG